MQNTNQHSAGSDSLIEALFDLSPQEKKSKEKDTAKRRLQTRRAIEDYMESKRLKESIDDFDLD